ncbi:MAG TPA: hypothetical protein VGO50_07990 [Pyrinomonadaceae bacterium]|jgi:hypothetical protein|nr:hypothetical protein [Pyrinomonadaceae bacterium]
MGVKFADILEAVEELPTEEKEMLVDIVQHRLIEERRKALKSDIEASRKEFEEGAAKSSSVDEIMQEVMS